MTDYDRNLFPSDIRNLNWKQYIYEYALGARLYLIKDPFETMKLAHKRQGKLMVVHYTLTIMIFFIIFGISYYLLI